MMKFILKILFIGGLIFFSISCKKTYTCECKNSSGTYIAGETESTKRQAKNYCSGLSSGDTQCYME